MLGVAVLAIAMHNGNTRMQLCLAVSERIGSTCEVQCTGMQWSDLRVHGPFVAQDCLGFIDSNL